MDFYGDESHGPQNRSSRIRGGGLMTKGSQEDMEGRVAMCDTNKGAERPKPQSLEEQATKALRTVQKS